MTDQTKFRLSEISKIEKHFNQEINQRKSFSKKISKYVTAFYYIDKILIVISALSGEVCIISSVSVVGSLDGIAGASFTLVFSLTTGIIKKLLSKYDKKQKVKNRDKTLMLAKSKLNSLETLVSQTLIDMGRRYEEFITVLKEKDIYEKMKENVRNVNEKLEEKSENTRLNSVNSRT